MSIITEISNFIKNNIEKYIEELEEKGIKSKEWKYIVTDIEYNKDDKLYIVNIDFDIPDSFILYLESINDIVDSNTIEKIGRDYVRDFVDKTLKEKYGNINCLIWN